MWLFVACVALCCLCGSLLPVFVNVGDVLPCVFTDYFSSVYVAERPPFGKELFTRLTVCLLGKKVLVGKN